MSDSLASVLALTLQVALVATLACAPPCIALGYLLARRSFPGKRVIAAFVAVPLVVPPTAVGMLLLRLFATDGPLGPGRLGVDLGLVLTWRGAALASAVMCVPLFVRTAQVAFEAVPPELEAMARTLGHGRVETFFRFTLPMARRGLLATLLLGFTRALGEYGATVTLAGSIPGSTRTLASAITTADQAGDEAGARTLLILSVLIGFVSVYVAEALAARRSS